MNLSQVLLEGRKEDFLSKYKGKFTTENIKKIFLMSRDLSSNQKFLNFLGKVVTDSNIDEDLLKAKIAIEKFIKYQKNLDEKDINQYDSLKDIQDAIDKHENRVRRDVKEVEGADIVYEDDRFTVVTPKTYEASCYYGSGSKWCTAAKSSDQHFMSYNRDGKLFYFLDKKASTSNRFYKVALLQKYDGRQQYYDAPDKSFNNGWILGTPEFEKINNVIQNYMDSNYSEDIELFKDKARAEQEMRRRAQRDNRIRQERILRQMDDLRERDAWNRDNDLDDLGRKANALYEGLVDEWGVDIGEDESIYNLVPDTDGFYPGEIMAFKWLGEDENESSYIVGEWDDVYELAKMRLEELVDDMGLFESFNEDFIMGHLDVQEVVEWFREYYDDYIREEPESHFETEDLPLTKEQHSRLEKLEQEIEELYRRTRDTDSLPHGSDERGEVYDRIEELEEERDEIQENPEGEPTEGMIEDRIAGYLYDVRQNPRQYLQDYGFAEDTERLEEFIDKNAIIEDAIDMDGIGHNISHYDGATFETRVEGVDYYAFRID
jgi:hypothetical protein